MARFKYVLLAAALVATLGIFAAACDDDAETQNNAQQSDIDALQQSIDELSERQRQDEMKYAVITVGTLGLHDMDEQLNDTGEVDPSFATNTRTALRIWALTDWSEDLQSDAEALRQTGIELLAALQDEDVEAAASAAADLHSGEHDFSNAVWAELLGDLPEEEGGVEAHHDGGGETPAGEETPAAEATP